MQLWVIEKHAMIGVVLDSYLKHEWLVMKSMQFECSSLP